MANDFFDSGDYTGPADHTLGRASSVRNLAAAVEAAFDKLPSEAQLKRGTAVSGTDSGTANAYVVTLTHPASAYVDLMEVAFIPANTNTGASTANIDALGAKAIKRASGSDVQGGDLTAGSVVVLRYDGTALRLVSPNLGSESAAAASAAAAAASASAASGSATAASGSAASASSSASAASGSAVAAAASAVTAAGEAAAAAAAELAGRSVSGSGLATGGGTLDSDRTINVAAASQSEMEAATDDTKAATPGNMHWHPAMPKAWLKVTMSGGTPTIQASHNVASLTDNGVGDFAVNFTTAFSSAHYAMAGAGAIKNASYVASVGWNDNRTTTGAKAEIAVYSSSTYVDPDSWSAAFFGDQA